MICFFLVPNNVFELSSLFALDTLQLNMEEESCLFRYGSFPFQISSSLLDLQKEDELVDVTLVGDDGKLVRAHKVVLCAGSPVLKSLLSNPPHLQQLLYLRGSSYGQINSLLSLLYVGKTEIIMQDVASFVSLISDLKVSNFNFEKTGKKS